MDTSKEVASKETDFRFLCPFCHVSSYHPTSELGTQVDCPSCSKCVVLVVPRTIDRDVESSSVLSATGEKKSISAREQKPATPRTCPKGRDLVGFAIAVTGAHFLVTLIIWAMIILEGLIRLGPETPSIHLAPYLFWLLGILYFPVVIGDWMMPGFFFDYSLGIQIAIALCTNIVWGVAAALLWRRFGD